MGGDGQGESHFEDDPWVKTWRRWGNVWYRRFRGSPEERKEEPSDFYRCPSGLQTPAMSSSLATLHPCSKLFTTHPLQLITMKHIHPSQSSKQAWRRMVLWATSTNLPSEHSWSLSFLWMPDRLLPLKSRKKLKEVLCGSSGNCVYLLPLGKSLLGCFPLFLSLHWSWAYVASTTPSQFCKAQRSHPWSWAPPAIHTCCAAV